MGRPSSSHCLRVRAGSLAEVRRAGSMPSTPNAMISFLIFTSMRLKGCSALRLSLGGEVGETGNGAELGDEGVDVSRVCPRRRG